MGQPRGGTSRRQEHRGLLPLSSSMVLLIRRGAQGRWEQRLPGSSTLSPSVTLQKNLGMSGGAGRMRPKG